MPSFEKHHEDGVLRQIEAFKDEMDGFFLRRFVQRRQTADEAPGACKPSDVIVESLVSTVECLARIRPVSNFKAVG